MLLIVFLLFGSLLCICSCNPQNESIEPGLNRLNLNWDCNIDKGSEYIVVIGDIQEYTNGNTYKSYYGATMDWILSQHILGANIRCVLQTGDITNLNTVNQYDIFYQYTLPVAKYLPYVACIGNHDYTWDSDFKINGRNQTLFSNYTSFKLTDSLVVARFEDHKMENVVVQIEILGEILYILSLEFGPRAEVLEWAKSFVMKHQNERFILMTHEFLTGKGGRICSGSYAERQLSNTTWSSPEQVWQRLVKDNDNIFCVLCGHNGFFTYLLSENANGRLVPQILFNLQYQENGGDGWVQLWEFPQNSDSVSIRVYNTLSREWNNDAGELKFRYKY